jgi:hypothetical protein
MNVDRTKLKVQNQEKNLNFKYPFFGPENYFKIQRQIKKAKLILPSMSQLVSLVYSTFNSEVEHSEEIKQIMEHFLMWGFTGNLYIPNRGIYIQDNPEIKYGKLLMEESELVKKLEENDNSVRFVNFGFEVGKMSPLELSKNQYIIGLVGEEGADKLAEITGKYKIESYLWAFKKVNETLKRVSGLSLVRSFNCRISLDSNNEGDDKFRYAIGIQKIGGKI